MQYIAAGMKIAPVLLRRAASNLLHPVLLGVPGDSRHCNAATFQMNEEQHVISHQPTPTEHFHGEEITARQHIHMSGKEVRPGCDLAALGRRSDALPAQNVSYCLIGDRMAQVG